MADKQLAYHGEFTVEQRKMMTAQALQELRKAKKLSQKEVAAFLNIPATTYNTYESGRTEPPLEYLVRLSHLYEMPIDAIVQRDRTYGTADDLGKQMKAVKAELASLDKTLSDQGKANPSTTALIATLNKLANALEAYSKTEAAQKALGKSEQD